MGFSIREILNAVEHLGGPSLISDLEQAVSACDKEEDIVWPWMPAIESCVDVMLLLSSDSSARPSSSSARRLTSAGSWLEESRGISGSRPPTTSAPLPPSQYSIFNHAVSTAISQDDLQANDEEDDDFHFGNRAAEFQAAYSELMTGGLDREVDEEIRPEAAEGSEAAVVSSCDFGIWPPRQRSNFGHSPDLMTIPTPSMSSSDSDTTTG